MKLTQAQIKELAGHLDTGMRCFVNKETGEIAEFLDWEDMFYDSIEEEEERRTKIEKEWTDYVEIEKPSSREGFEYMASFVNQLPDGEIRTRLVNALNGRKPFRNFKDQLYHDEEVRAKWFKHHEQALMEYVTNHLTLDFEIEEELLTEPEEAYDFNGKTFVLSSRKAMEATNVETQFIFSQDQRLVTADYRGGSVQFGKIIAKLEKDHLQMSYQCLTVEQELVIGQASANIEMGENGELRLIIDWQSLIDKGISGVSAYVEM